MWLWDGESFSQAAEEDATLPRCVVGEITLTPALRR